ncbi:MAG: sulfotransferase family protein, partial [Nocardioides sp.]
MNPRHFLVIGAQRCGTTYLHGLLAEHPEIAMARAGSPEPKVFLSDDVLDGGIEKYVAEWFAHAGDARLLGEKSTSYLESPAAIARVQAVLGAPPLVVQLRDPIARAVSGWRFSTDNGLEDRPLADALAENLEGPRPWDPTQTSTSPYAYLERGRYAELLAPWLDAFPGLVRVQFLEELVADPDLVGELYAFLGVDPTVRPAAQGEPVNRSDFPADALDPGLVASLRDHFAVADRALARLLERPLPWST